MIAIFQRCKNTNGIFRSGYGLGVGGDLLWSGYFGLGGAPTHSCHRTNSASGIIRVSSVASTLYLFACSLIKADDTKRSGRNSSLPGMASRTRHRKTSFINHDGRDELCLWRQDQDPCRLPDTRSGSLVLPTLCSKAEDRSPRSSVPIRQIKE